MLRIIAISVLLGLFAPVSLADNADIKKAANGIIDTGAVDVVEQLVDLGAESVEAAAAVIEVVAGGEPRVLPEVMAGLSAVMPLRSFSAAVNIAHAALDPSEAQYVAKLAAQINSGEGKGKGSERSEVASERRNETPNNVEDGRPPEDPPGRRPEPDEPSLLERILALVFDVLGIDPPASPS